MESFGNASEPAASLCLIGAPTFDPGDFTRSAWTPTGWTFWRHENQAVTASILLLA